MYHKHHTRGIVLSGKPEGEDSRRLNLFTENFGLLSVRVQGARNIYSKLRSGSQNFSFGDFSLIHGKTGWKLVSVRVRVNFFETIRFSDEKLKMTGNILRLVQKLVSEEAHIGDEVGREVKSS